MAEETVNILTIKSDDLDKERLEQLIKSRESFVVVGITRMDHTVEFIEKTIERQRLSVRVYTENRSVGILAAAIPTGITQAVGVVTAIGIGIHNLATFNPHYELGKNLLKYTLSVTFKR